MGYYMNVKELRDLIAGLPDDASVIIWYDVEMTEDTGYVRHGFVTGPEINGQDSALHLNVTV